jgi:hypothetical protein
MIRATCTVLYLCSDSPNRTQLQESTISTWISLISVMQHISLFIHHATQPVLAEVPELQNPDQAAAGDHAADHRNSMKEHPRKGAPITI